MKQRMLKWAEKHEEMPFNNCGYYCNFLPCVSYFPSFSYDAKGTSYFCAEQVASFLKDCNVKGFENISTHTCTPDIIYTILEKNGSIIKMLKPPRLLLRTKQTKPYEKFIIPHEKYSIV